MTDYRCRHCGYFLCSSELQAGTVRVVCRQCRASQTVKFRGAAGAPARLVRLAGANGTR